MIRTTMVLLAGAMFAGGCQDAVYGPRSYRSNNVDGSGYAGGAVHGNAEFRDSMSGSDGYATRTTTGDSARMASSQADRAPRAEATPPSPRADVSPSDASGTNGVASNHDDVSRATASSDTVRSQPKPTPQPKAQPELQPQPKDAAGDVTPKTGPDATNGRDPERVAAANTSRYPDDLKASDDLNAAVTLDPEAKSLRISNHSGQEIIGGKVWVNENFVTPVASLPAGATLELKANQFYDRDGKTLPSVNDANRVQLQTVGKLFNLKVQDKQQQPELNK